MEKFAIITFDPAVMGGKAGIRGLRVTVGTIVGLLAAGRSHEEILKAYPYLDVKISIRLWPMQSGGSKNGKLHWSLPECEDSDRMEGITMNLAGWTPLTEIRGVTQDSPAPRSVRFPCGNHVTIPPRGVRGSGWTGVLREIATWLVHNERLTHENADLWHPNVRDVPNRYVTFALSAEQARDPELRVPPNRKVKNLTEIGGGVYMDRDWEAQDAVDGAVALVRHCEENPCEILVNY